MNPCPASAQRGFTMIEMLVVLALAGVLLALAVPSFINTLAKNRLEGVANELVTDVQFARSEAVARNAVVGVFVGSNCYVVYTVGSSSASACAALGTGATAIKRMTIDAGSTTSLAFSSNNSKAFLQFEPVRGAATNIDGTDDYSGHVIVSSTAGAWQLRADLNQFGRVRICSPSGTFPGYPSC